MDWSGSGQGQEAGCNEPLGSVKCVVLIWLAEELLASQEGLWFTEPVSQSVSQPSSQSVSQSATYPCSLYNKVLGIIFLPKIEQVTGGWRQWQNKNFLICRLQKLLLEWSKQGHTCILGEVWKLTERHVTNANIFGETWKRDFIRQT